MFENKKLSREAALEAEVVRQANEAIRSGARHIGAMLKKKAEEEEYAAELAVA